MQGPTQTSRTRQPITTTLGVDPGKTGAIAILQNNHLISVHDMPYRDERVSAPHLAALLRDLGPATAWVEAAQPMPKQGVKSVFTYATGYGVILGVLGALTIPTHHVRPVTWKRALTLKADKEGSLRRATELWPHLADRFARRKDDGRAEAALIGLYGYQQNRGVQFVEGPATTLEAPVD